MEKETPLYTGKEDMVFRIMLSIIDEELNKMGSNDRVRFMQDIRNTMNDRLAEYESRFSLKRLGLR